MSRPELEQNILDLTPDSLIVIKIKKETVIRDCISVRDKDFIDSEGVYGYSCHDSCIDPSNKEANILSLLHFWSGFLSIPKNIGIVSFSCDDLCEMEDVLEFCIDLSQGRSNENHDHYLIKLKDFEKNKIKIKSSLAVAGVVYISENEVVRNNGRKIIDKVNAICENKSDYFIRIK